MVDEKKYLIMTKNKNSSIKSEYSFYKSSVVNTNNLVELYKHSIDISEIIIANDYYYLGKSRINKLTNIVDFLDSFDNVDGQLISNNGITEDKFLFNSIQDGNHKIQLFGIIDRYFYKNKKTENKGKYHNRLTVFYGDTLNDLRNESSSMRSESIHAIDNSIFRSTEFFDTELISDLRTLFDNSDGEEMINTNSLDLKPKDNLLSSLLTLRGLNIDSNIKLVKSSIDTEYNNESCSICLEDLGNEYCKLPCNHYFHLDCLDSYFDTFSTNNPIESLDSNSGQSKDKVGLINCPNCRNEFKVINKMNLLDSKISKIISSNDFLPINSDETSKFNIQLKDIFGNICFKMVKIGEDIYSIEFNDKIISKMNYNVCKILAMINIVS